MPSEKCLNSYIKAFRYEKILDSKVPGRKMYFKEVDSGMILLKSFESSKYVNFYFNEKIKKFKKTDLLVCAIEKIPAAWEEENE